MATKNDMLKYKPQLEVERPKNEVTRHFESILKQSKRKDKEIIKNREKYGHLSNN